MDPKASALEKDAYSHEVISFGFWVGDDNTPEPAYYAYAAPSPGGLANDILEPKEAFWIDANGSPMAILRYAQVAESTEPRKMVLDFLESAYSLAAHRAGWPVDELKVPDLDNL